MKRKTLSLWHCKVSSPVNLNPPKTDNLLGNAGQQPIRRRLGRRGAGMAEGPQSLRVVGGFMNVDVPLASSRRQDAYGLSRICPCQVREMTEGAAVREVIGGVMGGKLHRLERRNSCNQQHYREQPQAQAAKFHRRSELYTLVPLPPILYGIQQNARVAIHGARKASAGKHNRRYSRTRVARYHSADGRFRACAIATSRSCNSPIVSGLTACPNRTSVLAILSAFNPTYHLGLPPRRLPLTRQSSGRYSEEKAEKWRKPTDPHEGVP